MKMRTSEVRNTGMMESWSAGLSTSASRNLIHKSINPTFPDYVVKRTTSSGKHYSIIPFFRFLPLASCLLLLSTCLFPSTALAGTPTASDIVRNVQDNYKKTDDAVIRFTQTVTYPLSKLSKTTTGILYLKKNNKYKIDTGDKVIVTDGKTSWIYMPASNQVLIDKFRDDKNTVTPNQFLLDVPANYFAVLLSTNKNGGETTYTLRLTPKSDNSFIRGITIVVNSDWAIRSADVSDMNDTGYKYKVDSIKLNSGLSDSEFEFVPPKGTQVVDLRNR